MQEVGIPIEGICTNCQEEVLILKGHIDKKHKKCKKGKWIRKPKPKVEKEKEK